MSRLQVGDNYSLEVGEAGTYRLKIMNAVYGPSTEKLLEEIGLEGKRVLDVGCGTGNVSCWIARQVGETGSVVGVDVSEEQTEIAKKNADAIGLKNISFKVGNAYETGVERESFDIAYCRFVLCHLMQPENALREMLATLKTGGTLVCEDLDISGGFSDPPIEAFDKMNQSIQDVAKGRSVGFNIGRQLHRLFREAGLTDIKINIVQPAF